MEKTIIIGAGINGLLLGALLANDGIHVTILEKNSFPGGRAFVYERGGFSMDYGVHLTRFGQKSALAKIMKRIGADVTFRKLGASYVVKENGEKLLFPTSPSGIFSSKMFTFSEKIRLISLLVKIKKGTFNNGFMDVSLEKWMTRTGITGGIRMYLELLSASVMVCPSVEITSSGEMFRNLHKVFSTGHSAEYLECGWKPVYESLARAIEKNGVIQYGTKADSVIIRNGKACGVTAGKKRFMADTVVINAPVQHLFRMLPKKLFDKKYVAQCENLVPTSGIFFDIALKKRIADCDGLLYTYNPITYGLITSNLCNELAPEGRQLLTMFYPTSIDDVRNTSMRKYRKQELWRAIKRYFPDIDDCILWKRESSLTMIDGAQININQTDDKRPGPVVPVVSNLYLVGDSIAAPGAGGDVGNESVLETYAAMTGITF